MTCHHCATLSAEVTRLTAERDALAAEVNRLRDYLDWWQKGRAIEMSEVREHLASHGCHLFTPEPDDAIAGWDEANLHKPAT